MENFVTTRIQVKKEPTENPMPLQFYEVQENENGERKFVKSDIVKPSLAEDFNIQNNAIYRRLSHGVAERSSCDIVDFEQKINDLYVE